MAKTKRKRTRADYGCNRIDYAEAADRLEVILDILTGNTVGAQSIKVDRDAAARAIAYCRWRAANGVHPIDAEYAACDEETDMLQFISVHDLCASWVMQGDPT